MPEPRFNRPCSADGRANASDLTYRGSHPPCGPRNSRPGASRAHRGCPRQLLTHHLHDSRSDSSSTAKGPFVLDPRTRALPSNITPSARASRCVPPYSRRLEPRELASRVPSELFNKPRASCSSRPPVSGSRRRRLPDRRYQPDESRALITIEDPSSSSTDKRCIVTSATRPGRDNVRTLCAARSARTLLDPLGES